MNKIKVLIRDRNTLELLEDAKKGDVIDLLELDSIDNTLIEKAINEKKDFIYNKKIEEEKRALKSDFENSLLKEKEILSAQFQKQKDELLKQISEKEVQISKLESSKESEIKTKILEEKEKINTEFIKLQNENELLKDQIKTSVQNSIEKTKLELNNNFEKERNSLNLKIKEQENLLTSLKDSFKIEKMEEITKLTEKYNEQLRKLEQENADLKRAKATLNVKNIGEDLEIWCDNEVKSYMQNGFFNCLWIKDNKVIKEEGDKKGSKADYIFKIYRNEKKLEDQLLSSICLEMKDENPDSINKKSNEDYYKALDNNRQKKNCEYALLVSNLDSDKTNDIPIYKVNEYNNMYVVRPAYLMVFLNMINSLVSRFANILNAEKEEEIELKNKELIMEEFFKIKETYLDKPLALLNKQLEEIIKSNTLIRENSIKIEKSISAIRSSYLDQISLKLEKFEIKLNKITKK